MEMLIKATIGAAALAFVLAVFSSAAVGGSMFGVLPEAYSRACTNLALLAIAASVALDGKAGGG
ncbi:MAG: hypothetical protein ACE5FL_14645 [Myxococcota bacterium]